MVAMEATDTGDVDVDDQRAVELSTLAAIFPEMVVDDNDRYTVSLDVPVNPARVVTVAFPAADNHEAAGANGDGTENGNRNRDDDTHALTYLPSVRLTVSLPDGYPEERPPRFAVSASLPWLPRAVLKRLEDDGPRLWEELGHEPVVFHYVDHVQQAADDVFGLVDSSGCLAVPTQHKVAILDYDGKAKQAAFARETFVCGICLDPKKGAVCHSMQVCGHVFCVPCLQDFYSNAIREGDLATIRCLEPNCAKKREEALRAGVGAGGGGNNSKKPRSKPKMVSVSPGELLQIPIEESLVKRYIDLRYKTELESDKNTIYCPRAWCNGAARSKRRRKKPQGLSLLGSGEESDTDTYSDGDDADVDAQGQPRAAGNSHHDAAAAATDDDNDNDDNDDEDRLCICEDCGFAFCRRCFLSWHGDFVLCTPRKANGEITAEDKASLAYLARHTTPCPTCAAPAQKTRGCNHMICFRCNTHFCYLCSAWLEPTNPYRHFGVAPNGATTSCHNRLWELEFGDGDEADARAAAGGGGVHGGLDLDSDDEEDEDEDEDEGWDDEEEEEEEGGVFRNRAHRGGGGRVRGRWQEPGQRAANRDRRAPAAGDAVRQVDVAREGPLVLRIAVDRAPAPAPVPGPGGHHFRLDNDNNVGGRGPPGRGRVVLGRGRGRGRGRGQGDRAGRGGGGGGGGGEGWPAAPEARHWADDGGVGGHGPAADGPARGRPGHHPGAAADLLNADMEVWVRNFVELALADNEDEMEDEMEDGQMGFMIFD
ncbi:RWD domain-containing protein [Niveomyces insectorum RCEF 264]|uniref:RBR-type E3 ubiquitin transferase n=1 Tax=Niveomyces insectorum RCEF 264 TaxID=1081102 RepID=A0A167TD62_9HYPO|nr:RWD domain-containing protein [Niveomyces insectorum RCEF 264]